MIVGVTRITLHLPENQSLKGKRRVIKSLMARVRNKFNVSIAEVDDNDSHTTAVLGVACATNSSRHADDVLSEVVAFIESEEGDFVFTDEQRDIQGGF